MGSPRWATVWVEHEIKVEAMRPNWTAPHLVFGLRPRWPSARNGALSNFLASGIALFRLAFHAGAASQTSRVTAGWSLTDGPQLDTAT